MKYDLLTEKKWKYLQKIYHLTPRELQVSQLVCNGLDNNKISKELGIALGTVKTHLLNVYRRVRIKNKISLLLRFLEDIKKEGDDK